MHFRIGTLLLLAACAAPSPSTARRGGVVPPHLADLDGDGDLDQVELDFDVLVVRENRPGGALEHRYAPAASGEDEHTDLEILDVDGDGDLDVLAVGENNLSGRDCALVAWDNRGAEGFRWHRLSSGAYGWPCEDLALGDVDGDGRLDAVAAELLDGRVHVFLAADGLAERAAHDLGGCPDFTRGLDLADLDGDGGDEVLCATMAPPAALVRLAVLRAGRPPLELVRVEPGAVALAPARFEDVDGDGDLDVSVELGSGRHAALQAGGDFGALLPR